MKNLITTNWTFYVKLNSILFNYNFDAIVATAFIKKQRNSIIYLNSNKVNRIIIVHDSQR